MLIEMADLKLSKYSTCGRVFSLPLSLPMLQPEAPLFHQNGEIISILSGKKLLKYM